MKKEIKFRAWNIKKNIMIYSLTLNFKSHLIITNFETLKYEDIELMQYTGLKDKNGKEIYEKDIVKKGRNITEVIAGYEYGICYKQKCKSGDFIFTEINANNTEIIGNIHENPNLIK